MRIIERIEKFIGALRQSVSRSEEEVYSVQRVRDLQTGLIVEVPADVQQEAVETYATVVAKAFTTGKTVISNLPVSESPPLQPE